MKRKLRLLTALLLSLALLCGCSGGTSLGEKMAGLLAQQGSGARVTNEDLVYERPDPEQLEQMRCAGLALAAVNDNGLVTVLAFGARPGEDMTLQATVTEVQR
jgi:hypothetical protein